MRHERRRTKNRNIARQRTWTFQPEPDVRAAVVRKIGEAPERGELTALLNRAIKSDPELGPSVMSFKKARLDAELAEINSPAKDAGKGNSYHNEKKDALRLVGEQQKPEKGRR